MKHYNIPVFISHLGCPYQCIYCDQKKIATADVPCPDQVHSIIESHLQTMPADSQIEVAFFGGNFTDIDRNLQEEYLKAVRPFILDGKISGIRISTRPDSINEEALDVLKRNHVKTIELGVQSFSDEVLKASSRGYQADVVFKSSQLIKKWHFQLGVQLMVGLPGDTFEYDMKSVQSTIMIHPDMVRIYPTLVISGTALEKLYLTGRYNPLALGTAIEICREMLLRLEIENIPVIRMGLHAGEDLRSDGVIVAGPFHPAFGELVEQSVFLEQAFVLIQSSIEQKDLPEGIDLFVNPRDLSKMIGWKRRNVEELQIRLHLKKVNVKTDAKLHKNEISVSKAGDSVAVKLNREAFIQAHVF